MNSRFLRGSWTITLSLAATGALSVWLVFLPGLQTIDQLREEVEKQRNQLAQASTLGPALAVTQRLAGEAASYNRAWAGTAPAEGELPAVYGRIYELAGRAGTATTRFAPEEAEVHDWVYDVPISMGCTGTFGQVFQFLSGVEGLPEEVWVKEVTLENSGDGETVRCDAKLVIFSGNPGNSDYGAKSD